MCGGYGAEQSKLYLGHQQVAQHSWWVCGVFLLPYFQWSGQHLWVVELARGVMLRQGLALPAHQTAEACWMLTLVVADCKPAGIGLFMPSKWTNNWLCLGVRWQDSSEHCGNKACLLI